MGLEDGGWEPEQWETLDLRVSLSCNLCIKHTYSSNRGDSREHGSHKGAL